MTAPAIYQQINRAIESSPLSRDEVARRAGVSRGTLWRLQSGEVVGVNVLEAVAGVLGLEVRLLVVADQEER